ncbi:MAG: glucan ABC transporter ATP-binding protein/ permease [Thiotrichales bacterium]
MTSLGILRTYGRVIALLKPVRGIAVLLTLANLALAAVPFAEPILFGRAIDLLTAAPTRGAEATLNDGVKVFGLWLIISLFGIGAGILVALHADRLAHRLRSTTSAYFFEHVLQLHLGFHREGHSGRLLKIMMRSADHLFGLWLAIFREHLSSVVALLVLLPMTLFLNWKLGSVLIVLILVSVILTVLVSRRTHAAQREVESHHSAVAEHAVDALGNVVLVQSFVRRAEETQTMREMMNRLLAAQFPVLNWWALVNVLNGAAASVTVITIFALGAWLSLNGEATVGEIVTFMGFANHLIGRLDQVIGFFNRLFHQAPSLAEFFEILDTRSAVRDAPNARALTDVSGRIEFDQVGFAYDNGRQALTDISFIAEPGRTIALVGETGAGKSTAMNLLHRQYDPQHGVIRLDGVDIRDFTLDSLRHHIGVVFQESLLFYRSIADNLRVGNPDATDAELEHAARLAQAHEFILAQPNGYQSRIGERGSNLSGGERQRLAIARVLLKNPPILILDEATSALDTATEAQVQQALKALMNGRTTFVIAHRLATIREADEILVFRQGRIIERGNFQQLARQGGYFTELVTKQFPVEQDMRTPA